MRRWRQRWRRPVRPGGGGAPAELGEAFAGKGGLQQGGLEGFDGAPLGLVILAPDEQVVGLCFPGAAVLASGLSLRARHKRFDGPVEGDQAQAGVRR